MQCFQTARRSGSRKAYSTLTVLATKPIRYRFRRQLRRLWVLFLQPLGEQFRFGADAGFSLTAIPSGAVFRFNEMH
jgi:hypothetical protein